MFNWLKNRYSSHQSMGADLDDQFKGLTEKLLGPQALAAALAQTTSEHADLVRTGQVTAPAHKREGDSAINIWRDIRFETLSRLFNYGRSDPMLLAEHEKQLDVLQCLLDEKPHLEIPQPRGEVLADTIQAAVQMYVYMDHVGSEVCDSMTDRYTLESRNKNILDDLLERAEQLRADQQDFSAALGTKHSDMPEIPRTLLEELYDDVTRKTKSIALTARFGPNPMASINLMDSKLRESGDDDGRFREAVDRFMAAKDPDE